MGKLNFNDMNKVSGGKLSISEKDGKFRVYKEYDKVFGSKEEAEAWLHAKAEKCLDCECGKGEGPHCHRDGHRPGNLGLLPPPPGLN